MILLFKYLHEDCQSWVGEASGEFTVRNAYIMILHKSRMANLLQNNIDHKSFYRKL